MPERLIGGAVGLWKAAFMNLRLRPMTHEEVSSWMDTAREAFAVERMEAGEPEQAARHIADAQYADYFPGGRPAHRHELMVLEEDGARVGMVWVGPHPRRPEASEAAWLYNIEIDRDRRGRGFGRAALRLVEAHLGRSGITELGLNVFGHNEVARRLYATAGYREAAVTMVKKLPLP